MAVPTRRRDTGRPAQSQETRLPTAWEPLARPPWNVEPLERLRTVSRMLDELTADWPGFGALAGDGFSTPLGDLEELDDAWLLRVELPGVKRDDIDIQVAGPGPPTTATGWDDRHRHPGRAGDRPGLEINAELVFGEPATGRGRRLGGNHRRQPVGVQPGQVGARAVGAVAIDHRRDGLLALAWD
jgi:hypothetical protein